MGVQGAMTGIEGDLNLSKTIQSSWQSAYIHLWKVTPQKHDHGAVVHDQRVIHKDQYTISKIKGFRILAPEKKCIYKLVEFNPR